MVELKPTTTRLPYAQSNPSAPKAAHVHAPKATKISARAPGHPTTLKQTTTSTGASKTLPSYPRSGSPDSEKRSRCRHHARWDMVPSAKWCKMHQGII
ncbi:hypothetical protein PtrSN001C_000019 [Pyrenophora tritici-repentis]|nr:hypothetical protein PtrSN001C_000019 [Pyrenophora tritici-repentis]